jgi:hypothetical protein
MKKENFPQKPGKALDRFLRGEITKGHDLNGDCAKQDRLFPRSIGKTNWHMVETISEDGTISIDYAGDPIFSAHQVAEYVRKFCELNYLKVA